MKFLLLSSADIWNSFLHHCCSVGSGLGVHHVNMENHREASAFLMNSHRNQSSQTCYMPIVLFPVCGWMKCWVLLCASWTTKVWFSGLTLGPNMVTNLLAEWEVVKSALSCWTSDTVKRQTQFRSGLPCLSYEFQDHMKFFPFCRWMIWEQLERFAQIEVQL